MTCVLLLGDERKGGSKARVAAFAQWLQSRGCEVDVVLDRDSQLADRRGDLVVVFGGDGSLLAAARRMREQQRPTLGINVGRLGFLTACELEGAKETVELALAGKLTEEHRLLVLCQTIDAAGKAGESVVCMNDAVVSRAAQGGMITVRASRGAEEIATYRGDGLVVATATGSTAYSMAAGGPVLTPDLQALVLTPLASQALSARPLVVPVGQGVEVEVLETGGKRYAYLQLDGQVRLELPEGARAMIRPAPFAFRHLGPGSGHFFRVLRAKFGFTGLPGGMNPPA